MKQALYLYSNIHEYNFNRINLMIMIILENVYGKLAYKLTEWGKKME